MNIPVTGTTIARLAAISAGSLAFMLAAPVKGEAGAAQAYLAAAVLTGAIVVLFIAEALGRRQKLLEAIRIELNKLRRVYHVSKNLAGSSPKFRGWFTDLHGFVYEYLNLFAGKDFEAYDRFNAAFRRLSYHIYTVPDVETKKEELLYQDLLRTTASVAEARQQIKELWDNRLSAYGWTVVLLMVAGFAVVSVLAAADTAFSRLAAGIGLAAALLAVDLLWEADTLSSEKKGMAKRYVDNVGRLELGRRE